MKVSIQAGIYASVCMFIIGYFILNEIWWATFLFFGISMYLAPIVSYAANTQKG